MGFQNSSGCQGGDVCTCSQMLLCVYEMQHVQSRKGKAQRQLECVPRPGAMTEHWIQQSVHVFYLAGTEHESAKSGMHLVSCTWETSDSQPWPSQKQCAAVHQVCSGVCLLVCEDELSTDARHTPSDSACDMSNWHCIPACGQGAVLLPGQMPKGAHCDTHPVWTPSPHQTSR